MTVLRWFAGCFLVLALTIAGAGTANQEVRVALVIGNGSYQHVTTLPNPPNDAVAIANKLGGLGFDVTTAVDVDLADMRAAVERFAGDSRGADVALIFYAGHGVQDAGENYLLPVDARIRSGALPGLQGILAL